MARWLLLVVVFVLVVAGIGVAYLVAPPIGKAASWVGNLIMWATEQQPFVMGIVVSVIVGIALTLPISSAAICAANGVDLREPLKPTVPADCQEITLPWGSVMETMVLLNVDLM